MLQDQDTGTLLRDHHEEINIEKVGLLSNLFTKKTIYLQNPLQLTAFKRYKHLFDWISVPLNNLVYLG